jgi:hypothetical protein
MSVIEFQTYIDHGTIELPTHTGRDLFLKRDKTLLLSLNKHAVMVRCGFSDSMGRALC